MCRIILHRFSRTVSWSLVSLWMYVWIHPFIATSWLQYFFNDRYMGIVNLWFIILSMMRFIVWMTKIMMIIFIVCGWCFRNSVPSQAINDDIYCMWMIQIIVRMIHDSWFFCKKMNDSLWDEWFKINYENENDNDSNYWKMIVSGNYYDQW
jgi:hypothetical protein